MTRETLFLHSPANFPTQSFTSQNLPRSPVLSLSSVCYIQVTRHYGNPQAVFLMCLEIFLGLGGEEADKMQVQQDLHDIKYKDWCILISDRLMHGVQKDDIALRA